MLQRGVAMASSYRTPSGGRGSSSTGAASDTRRPAAPGNTAAAAADMNTAAAAAATTTSTTGRSTKPQRGTLSARPTEARIQSYLATLHIVPGSDLRPTEAQLRWNQFHRKSKARYTRSVVEALMVHPETVAEVEGAEEGDGDTTEESCSDSDSNDGVGAGGTSRASLASGVEYAGIASPRGGSDAHSNGPPTSRGRAKPKRRRKKQRRPGQPNISRGRRATLRVSDRRYRDRKQDIDRRGYRRRCIHGDDEFDAAFEQHRNVFVSPTKDSSGASGGVEGSGATASSASRTTQSPPLAPGSRTKLRQAAGSAAAMTMTTSPNSNYASQDALVEAFGDDFLPVSHDLDAGGDGIGESCEHDGGGSRGSRGGGPVSSSPFRKAAAQNAAAAAAERHHGKRGGHYTNQGRTVSASTARFTRDLDDNDEDRVRRFEDILSALKVSEETTASKDTAAIPPVAGGGRRWTRPGNLTGTNASTNSQQKPKWGDGPATFDRGASWLVHMPKVKGSASKYKSSLELQDKGASWLSHVPRSVPRYTVEKGRLIVSPTNSKGEQVESPELQDRGASWLGHIPSREDRLAAERAAAAASRSLKIDVTAEASASPEKVVSPGEAKFNEIISQFHSIEGMLAEQREMELLKSGGRRHGGASPAKAGIDGGTGANGVASPNMSQMHLLQTSLAANTGKMASSPNRVMRTSRGGVPQSPMYHSNSIQGKLAGESSKSVAFPDVSQTPRALVPADNTDATASTGTPSPMSQFRSIQDKLGAPTGSGPHHTASSQNPQIRIAQDEGVDEVMSPNSELQASPISQFNSIQKKLGIHSTLDVEEEEDDPDHDFAAFFSQSKGKGRESLDPMATAVATSGAKAAGVKIPQGRESVSKDDADLLQHEGDFGVPEAPTPKYKDYKPSEFRDNRESQMEVLHEDEVDDEPSPTASHSPSDQENYQHAAEKQVLNGNDGTPLAPSAKVVPDTTDSAPRKGGVGFMRKMFSPGERKKSQIDPKEQDGQSLDASLAISSETNQGLDSRFKGSTDTTPRDAADPPGSRVAPQHSIREQSRSQDDYNHDGSSQVAPTELSAEERMNEMKNMILSRGNEEQSAGRFMIDTDGTTSDVSIGSGTEDEYAKLRLGSLMLSPTIITKRYQQAVASIEARNWDQVTYLLSANPWLAEMTDIRNDQYLLHKLALYGAGEAVSDDSMSTRSATAAPEQLTLDLIEKCPAAVTKFDHEGNLPLHMSATSGNLEMIRQLGERFSSGASVQNHDGMLPLHLAVLSCAYPSGAGGSTSPSRIVKAVIDLFPGGIGVIDNEGNLPIHIASANLSGDLGVDVLFLLIDEGEKQAANLRMRRDPRTKTMSKPGDEDDEEDNDADENSKDVETPYCNLVKNKEGNTPLREAIVTHAGWQIVEMLIQGGGGEEAALEPDKYDRQNALHLLIRGDYADPASVLSLLKIMPSIATYPDGDGVLPIEAACMASMPRAVILALVLVDLPVDLDDKDAVKVREGRGASWAFLTCDCDDAHIDIVEEVLSICSYRQTRELCFLRSGGSGQKGSTVISRATPRSKSALRKALRFIGRYEFLGSSPVHSEAEQGLKVFEALDFGTDKDPIPDGRAVLLKCFSKEDAYENEISRIKEIQFDTRVCVERVEYFCVHDFEAYSSANAPQQFCVAVEKPSLALSRVVAGSGDYRQDPERFHKYLTRVSMVLRLICKAINHLHGHGLLHGHISLQNCGKFGDKWKLMGIAEANFFNEDVSTWTMGEGIPPEATMLKPDRNGGLEEATVTLHNTLKASPAIDAWAFGKLMYEVLVGEPLIPFDYNMDAFYDDRNALVALAAWDESTLRDVVNEVVESGAGTLAADLISHCLCPVHKIGRRALKKSWPIRSGRTKGRFERAARTEGRKEVVRGECTYFELHIL